MGNRTSEYLYPIGTIFELEEPERSFTDVFVCLFSFVVFIPLLIMASEQKEFSS